MEMYFLGEGHQSASRDLNKFTAEVAKAFARTLMPHLQKLSSDNCTFLGLRVSLDSENVSSYQSVTKKKGQLYLPSVYGKLFLDKTVPYFSREEFYSVDPV